MRCLNCGEPLWNTLTERKGFCCVSCEKEYKEDQKVIKPSTMPMWSKKSPAGVYEKIKTKTSGWKK